MHHTHCFQNPNFGYLPDPTHHYSRLEPLFKKSLIFFRLSLQSQKSKRDRLISKPLNLKSFFFLFDPTNFVHYIPVCVALYPIHKGKSKWNTITVQLGNSIKEATYYYSDMLLYQVQIQGHPNQTVLFQMSLACVIIQKFLFL